MGSNTSNTYWDLYLQTLKPEIDIPNPDMTAIEFAETLKEYGIVCPPDSIVTGVNCRRDDIQGSDYSLRFTLRTKGIDSSLHISVTLTSDPNDWLITSLSGKSDSRFVIFNNSWQKIQGIVEKILRWDRTDTLKLQLAHFTKPNETILGGNPVVFTKELEETIDISHLSAVEIINRVLAAKEDDSSYFRLFTDEEIAQLRN